MIYSEPRYTKDLDIWVNPKRFGAPLQHGGITAESFADPNVVYQIGVAPVRADIITRLSGVDFEPAWRRRATTVSFLGITANFISREDLILNKQAPGRPRDLRDIKRMRKAST